MSALEQPTLADRSAARFWARLNRTPAPSKVVLTPELMQEILEDVARLGGHPETAGRAAGVPAQRWDKWRALGRKDMAADVDSIYAELERGITMAFASAEAASLTAIVNDDAWTSKAWIRERVEPHKYAQRREVNVNHRALPMIDTDLGTVDELEQLYALLRKFSPDPESQGLNKDRRPVLELMQADDVIEGTGSFSEAPAAREPAIPKSPGS